MSGVAFAAGLSLLLVGVIVGMALSRAMVFSAQALAQRAQRELGHAQAILGEAQERLTRSNELNEKASGHLRDAEQLHEASALARQGVHELIVALRDGNLERAVELLTAMAGSDPKGGDDAGA